MKMYEGFSVSDGIAYGKAITVCYERKFVRDEISDDEKENEIARFESLLSSYLESERVKAVDKKLESLLNVHIELIDDSYLKNTIKNKILEENKSLEKAIEETFNQICFELNNLESDYMRDRIYDYISIQEEFIRTLTSAKDVEITENKFILFIENLSPKIIDKYKNRLLGIVSTNGGKTSHASLYAKNLQIPYMICDSLDLKELKDENFDCILDCDGEKIFLSPNEDTISCYKNLLKSSQKEFLDTNIVRTRNNRYIRVCSNISSFEEFEVSLKNGTDGCGLFRTEFLYMSDDSPTEEYQFEIFKKLAESTDKPIIIRTFDIGADKKSKFFRLDEEKNPFLGLRGFRIYKEFHKELRKHLRAILRASAFGNLKIMIPMITTLEEILWIKNEILKIKDELKEERVDFDEDIEFGIMIETPASVFLFDILVKEVDFVSIGTNDLVQYMLACDRENSKMQLLYDCYDPSVIRSIHRVVDIAHRNGKRVSMCGNFASELDAVELLILLGIDEFSVTNDVLQKIKKRIKLFDQNNYLDFFENINKFKTGRSVLYYFDNK